jgi:hypothetical protein
MQRTIYNALFLAATLFASSANGAPIAYSVNSDSDNPQNEDGLYSIDLATGSHQRAGDLSAGIENRMDTEGLAFDMNGTLWGIDDDSRTMFPIDTLTGAVDTQNEISVASFPIGGGNDFGMTFTCDNELYVTSVVTQTLYSVDMNGTLTTIGSEGALGVNISALATYGNPVQLYGLGNGQLANGSTDSPNLYSIDLTTGVASEIGPLDQSDIFKYLQAGLAFDSNGTLWAITDRRVVDGGIADLPSQVLQINTNTGAATLVSTTTEVGFESLAIAPPAACGAEDDYYRLPTLGTGSRWLTICFFLFSGLIILGRRTH